MLAHTIAKKSPQAIAVGKKGFYAQRDKSLPEAYELANAGMVANMPMPDAEEGIAAFLGKRAPVWSDVCS